MVTDFLTGYGGPAWTVFLFVLLAVSVGSFVAWARREARIYDEARRYTVAIGRPFDQEQD